MAKAIRGMTAGMPYSERGTSRKDGTKPDPARMAIEQIK